MNSRDEYFLKQAEEIMEKAEDKMRGLDTSNAIMPEIEPKLAARHNDGKLPMDLVPTDAIKAMASVLKVGADKYALRNWEQGAYFSVPYASLMRHLLAFWEGEDYDKESGELHIAHILTNAAFLLRYYNEFPELDDRPKKKDA
jgi:hypothetical protein